MSLIVLLSVVVLWDCGTFVIKEVCWSQPLLVGGGLLNTDMTQQ